MTKVCYFSWTDMELHDLCAYLRRTGWELKTGLRNTKAVLYEKEGIELMLPVNDRFVDTGTRMSEAISLLAQFEDRSADQIVADIRRNHEGSETCREGRETEAEVEESATRSV
jgi:hypothetical protein